MEDKKASEANFLVGQPAEVRMTVSITRAATGKIETFDLVGHVEGEVSEQPQPHKED